MFTITKLSKGQVFDLEALLGQIAPKDVPTLKEMSALSKLRKKMTESVQDIHEKIAELNKLIKPMREAKATDEEMNEAGKEIMEQLGVLRVADASCELSDEQKECFKRWFVAKLKEQIKTVDACLLVAEAFEMDLESI